MDAPTPPRRWVLLRGLAREHRHFGAFVDAFAAAMPDAQLVPMDLAGFGAESARASPTSITAITDDLRARVRRRVDDAEPVGVVALSLGGMVALDWAARFPREVARAVVVNTSAADLSSPWERFALPMWPRIAQLVVMDALARERILIERTVNRRDFDQEALARAWAAWFHERAPHRRSFLAQIYAASRSRLPARVEAPVLVLTSRADRLVSWRCSERIATQLGAPLHVHDTAGHDLTFDDAAWVIERVRGWLAPVR